MNEVYYNLVELSEKLKVSYRTIQNYVYKGDLEAEKIGGRWYVNDNKLKAFIEGKKSRDLQFEISKSAWEYYKKTACIRQEVGTESDEFMRGYIKGVQVALIDLLDRTGAPYSLYRDDIAEIQERLEATDKELKRHYQTESEQE